MDLWEDDDTARDSYHWTMSETSVRPSRRDAMAMAAITAALLIGNIGPADTAQTERNIDAFAIVLILIAGGATLWRRTNPVPALAVATIASLTYWIMDYPLAGGGLALLVLLYSLAAHEPERARAVRVLVLFTIVISLVLIAGWLSPEENGVSVGLIVLNIVLFQLAWFAGDGIRGRRENVERLQEQIDAAQAEKVAATERAIEGERTRIARELHDIVAHSMSVIVVQSEGAQRLVGRDDEAVAEALAAIEATARTNLNDIRSTIGGLRSDAARTPLPELSRLPELVEQCAEAGLDVSLEVNGEQRSLPAMIELSGYRVVQESLTNTIKHGGPTASAAVTVDYRDDALAIEVVDDGRGAGATPETPGHGLLGMRERIEAVGGQLRTGPRQGGGYTVRAEIPVGAE